MRCFPLAALALGLAAAAQAQTPRSAPPSSRSAPPATRSPERPPHQSALRTLIEETPGRVVVVRHAALPAIPLQGGGTVQIESIGAFEPGYETERLFGVRIRVERDELPEHERTFYLEPRDVDPLARAIDTLEQVAASATQNATDAEFHVPDGFGVGFRTLDGKTERFVRASRGETRRFVLPRDGLVRLRDGIEAARRGIFGG
jgi:hypothetical protein